MRYMATMLAFVAVVSLSAPCDAAELVTTCGQHVKDGLLANDLDCNPLDGPAVWVTRELSLAGHTITGGDTAIYCGALGREGRCAIHGPGIVRGVSGTSFGVRGRKVSADGVTFENLELALAANKTTVSDCVVTGPSDSTWGGWLVYGRHVTVIGSTISNSSGFGVAAARSAVLIDSTVTGSRWDGVTSGGVIKLQSSSVTGNAVDCVVAVGCGGYDFSDKCADVTARRGVRIDASSNCEKSLLQERLCGKNDGPSVVDYRPGTNFGVCALD